MSSTSSITDVATLARVSKATVSRVLSGRRTKDDNIAKRVRDAAEQLNYQANSAASALRSDTTNTIGLIMPGPTDPLAARLLAELEPEVNRSDASCCWASATTSEPRRNASKPCSPAGSTGWWSCRRKTPTPQRSWMTTSA